MRVIMVAPCYYPVKGGTEITVRNLAIALNKNGVHVDVMAFNVNQIRIPKWQGKTEKIDEITVYRIPALSLFQIVQSVKITAGVNFLPGRFIHILKNYDIIHFHEIDMSFPFFSYLVKKPKIIHLHGIDYNFLKKHFISRFLFKHLVHIYISISKRMEKELTKLGIPKDKIVYVPNCVDTNLFKPQARKEDNMLLFVGRISKGKGLHILIKSLRYVREPVRLIIIGPTDWDTVYYQNILNLIERENRKGKHEIKYLGALELSELIEWYQKASIFILPSFGEGFPVTVLEALACETPVIATPVGGIPEIVENNVTGLLIQQNSPIELAKAIQYLLTNPDMRLKMGYEGRKRVMQQYSLNVTVKKLCNIYRQLQGMFPR
nr:glycosyltransferase family 4 protein [Candidatus Baldrarchaeota archaeon]